MSKPMLAKEVDDIKFSIDGKKYNTPNDRVCEIEKRLMMLDKDDILKFGEKIKGIKSHLGALNMSEFPRKDDEISDDRRINDAIEYCIKNNIKKLVLNDSAYVIKQKICIKHQGDANLTIEGLGLVDITCNTDEIALHIVSPSRNVDPYPNRIQNVVIKDVRFVGKGTGIGVKAEYFGYIKLENIIVNGFEYGGLIREGSELSMYDCTFCGSGVGLEFNGVQRELANVMLYNCRIHNNFRETILFNHIREISLYGCALMSTGEPVTVNSTGIINLHGCDLENFHGKPSLLVNQGYVNVQNCLIAGEFEGKIALNGGRLSLINNIYDLVHPKTVIIKNKKAELVTNDVVLPYDETGCWENYSLFKEKILNYNFIKELSKKKDAFKISDLSPFILANTNYRWDGDELVLLNGNYLELDHEMVKGVTHIIVECNKKNHVDGFIDGLANPEYLNTNGHAESWDIVTRKDGYSRQFYALNYPVNGIRIGANANGEYRIRDIKLYGDSLYKMLPK